MNALLHILIGVIGTVDQSENGWLLVETATEEEISFCFARDTDILVGTGREGTLVVVTRCMPVLK